MSSKKQILNLLETYSFEEGGKKVQYNLESLSPIDSGEEVKVGITYFDGFTETKYSEVRLGVIPYSNEMLGADTPNTYVTELARAPGVYYGKSGIQRVGYNPTSMRFLNVSKETFNNLKVFEMTLYNDSLVMVSKLDDGLTFDDGSKGDGSSPSPIHLGKLLEEEFQVSPLRVKELLGTDFTHLMSSDLGETFNKYREQVRLFSEVDMTPAGKQCLKFLMWHYNIPVEVDTVSPILTGEELLGIAAMYLNILKTGRGYDEDNLAFKVMVYGEEAMNSSLVETLQRINNVFRTADPGLDVMVPVNTLSEAIQAKIAEENSEKSKKEYIDNTNPFSSTSRTRKVQQNKSSSGRLSPQHLCRLCFHETPESDKAGKVMNLALGADRDEYGFLTCEYIKVRNGIAYPNEKVRLNSFDSMREVVCSYFDDLKVPEYTQCVVSTEYELRHRSEVTLMFASTKQSHSVATLFSVGDNGIAGKRCVMIASQLKQAVPVFGMEPKQVASEYDADIIPLLSTSLTARALCIEAAKHHKILFDSSADMKVIVSAPIQGEVIITTSYGTVTKPVKIRKVNESNTVIEYILDQSRTEFHGDDLVYKDTYTDTGKVALGVNLKVAFMTWGGYGYEDALIVTDEAITLGFFDVVHVETLKPDISGMNKRITTNKRVGNFLEQGQSKIFEWESMDGTKLTEDKLRQITDSPAMNGHILDVMLPKTHSNNPYKCRIRLGKILPPNLGDKIVGLFGNKSVIATVVPKHMMPYSFEYGVPHLIATPLGVPSRMNISQLQVAELGNNINEVKDKQIVLKKYGSASELIDEMKSSLPNYHESEVTMYDPISCKPFDRKITFGTSHFLRLNKYPCKEYMSRDIKASSSSINSGTLQPSGGKSTGGGLRLGEMEVWALTASNCFFVLNELLGVKRDGIIGYNYSMKPLTDSMNRSIGGSKLPSMMPYLRDRDLNISNTQDIMVHGLLALNLTYQTTPNNELKLRLLKPNELVKVHRAVKVGDRQDIYNEERVSPPNMDKIQRRNKGYYIDLGHPIPNPTFIESSTIQKMITFCKFPEPENFYKLSLNDKPKDKKNFKLSDMKLIAKSIRDMRFDLEFFSGGVFKRLVVPSTGRDVNMDILYLGLVETVLSYGPNTGSFTIYPIIGTKRDFDLIGYKDQLYRGIGAINVLLQTSSPNVTLALLQEKQSGKLRTYKSKENVDLDIEALENFMQLNSFTDILQDSVYVFPQDFRTVMEGKKNHLTTQYEKLLHESNAKLESNKLNSLYNTYKKICSLSSEESNKNKTATSIIDEISHKEGYGRDSIAGGRTVGNSRLILSMTMDLKVQQVGLPITVIAKQRPIAINNLINKIFKDISLPSDVFGNNCIKEIGFALRDVNMTRLVKLFKERNISSYLSVDSFISMLCDYFNAMEDKFICIVNRQPTLWKHGMIAMEEVAHKYETIRMHPIYATAYNADNDGDAIAIYHLHTREATQEARMNMMFNNRYLKLAHDLVLGLYYIGVNKPEITPQVALNAPAFNSKQLILTMLERGDLHPLSVITYTGETFTKDSGNITSSVGRILWGLFNPPNEDGTLNLDLPPDPKELNGKLQYIQNNLDANQLAKFIDGITELIKYTLKFAGYSALISEIASPYNEMDLMKKAKGYLETANVLLKEGLIPPNSFNMASAWRKVSKDLAPSVMSTISPDSSIMHFINSGARGKKEQIVQMRGLGGVGVTANNKEIGAPIMNSYSSGLNMVEACIDGESAMKGLVSLSQTTSEPGYLTRINVYENSNAIVTKEDCKHEAELILQYDSYGKMLRAYRMFLLSKKKLDTKERYTEEDIKAMEEARTRSVFIRSPLTCKAKGICETCLEYSYEEAKKNKILGIDVSQTIGESSTQSQLNVQHNLALLSAGKNENSTSKLKGIIQNNSLHKNSIAAYSKIDGTVYIVSHADKNYFTIKGDGENPQTASAYSHITNTLYVSNGDKVFAGQKLTDGYSDNETIFELGRSIQTQMDIFQYVIETSTVDNPKGLLPYEIICNSMFRLALRTDGAGNIINYRRVPKHRLHRANEPHLQIMEKQYKLLQADSMLSALCYEDFKTQLVSGVLGGTETFSSVMSRFLNSYDMSGYNKNPKVKGYKCYDYNAIVTMQQRFRELENNNKTNKTVMKPVTDQFINEERKPKNELTMNKFKSMRNKNKKLEEKDIVEVIDDTSSTIIAIEESTVFQ